MSVTVEGARVRPIQMIGNLLSGLAAPLPDPIDYSKLRGLPKSFGKEAGEYAVKGEVPAKSKDGWCIATFGGGCFCVCADAIPTLAQHGAFIFAR